MINLNCRHFRRREGVNYCQKFNHFMCELCNDDDDDDELLDMNEY